jgi:hypothetical protein
LVNGPSDSEQPKHFIPGDDDSTAPWSARALNSNVQISCSQCQTIVTERGSIKLWKDLPSENWAEMMDFWHCHRPHVPHDAQSALKKGYAADSKLALLPSVGMVDRSHFVLHPDDCRNLEVGHLIYSRSVAGKLYVCVSGSALFLPSPFAKQTVMGTKEPALPDFHVTLEGSVGIQMPQSDGIKEAHIQCQPLRLVCHSNTLVP